MIFLLLSFILSIENPPISGPGYYTNDITPDYPLTVLLNNGKYDCVFVWSHSSYNDATITVSKDDQSKEYVLKGETTAIVKGDNASILVSKQTTIHTWVIQKDLCDMNSLLFTTPSDYIKDYLTVKQNVNNLCLFFSKHNPKSTLSLNMMKSKNPQIQVYYENSFDGKPKSFRALFDEEINDQFFVQVQNPLGPISLIFSIEGKEPSDIPCEHIPIHMITIENEVEDEVIYGSSILCNREEEKKSIIPFVLIVALVVILIILFVILCITGFFKKLSRSFRKEYAHENPTVTLENDPNSILKIEEIPDLETDSDLEDLKSQESNEVKPINEKEKSEEKEEPKTE